MYSERIWECAKDKLTGSLSSATVTGEGDRKKGKTKDPPLPENTKETPLQYKEEVPPLAGKQD